MEKRMLLLGVCFMMTVSMNAQNSKNIRLNTPGKTGGAAIMDALSARRSMRAFDSSKDVSLQQLSDLLWAANGINRADGGRTAPSAKGSKDVDIYVIRKDGAYLYIPESDQLQWVTDVDLRKAAAGGQVFVENVPIMLILVSDVSRFGADGSSIRPQIREMAAMDAGIVSQNINLYCASAGLGTITRMSMDVDVLKTALSLTPTQLPMLNNAVGYPAK